MPPPRSQVRRQRSGRRRSAARRSTRSQFVSEWLVETGTIIGLVASCQPLLPLSRPPAEKPASPSTSARSSARLDYRRTCCGCGSAATRFPSRRATTTASASTAAEIAKLRAIKRLMDVGLRPEDHPRHPEELDALADGRIAPREPDPRRRSSARSSRCSSRTTHPRCNRRLRTC